MTIEEQFDEICYRSLDWVEGLFGDKDLDVEIVGVFSSKDYRFPHTAYDPEDDSRIEIRVPHVDEPWQLYRHLTHEFLHALTPNGLPGGQATMLEEGLAEHSSLYFMKSHFTFENVHGEVDQTYWEVNVPAYYRAAFLLVEQLVVAEGLEGMREGIRTLRRNTGLPFGKITADHLETVFFKAPRELLEALSRRFKDQQSEAQSQ